MKFHVKATTVAALAATGALGSLATWPAAAQAGPQRFELLEATVPQIQEALNVFREVTVQTTQRAEQSSTTVADLSALAQGLESEIGRFRL